MTLTFLQLNVYLSSSLWVKVAIDVHIRRIDTYKLLLVSVCKPSRCCVWRRKLSIFTGAFQVELFTRTVVSTEGIPLREWLAISVLAPWVTIDGELAVARVKHPLRLAIVTWEGHRYVHALLVTKVVFIRKEQVLGGGQNVCVFPMKHD